MNATLQAKADRLKEIDATTAGLSEEDVRIKAPSLWREKTQLLATIAQTRAEIEALEQTRQAAEATRRRREAFPPKLKALRKDAARLAKPIQDAAEALERAFDGMDALCAAHDVLVSEGHAVGETVPSLAELLSVSDGRLYSLRQSVQLLRAHPL